LVRDLVGERLKAAGVLERGLGVVDRAGPDDHQEAVVLAVEDIADRAPAGGDGFQAFLGRRKLVRDLARRRQKRVPRDVGVDEPFLVQLKRPGS